MLTLLVTTPIPLPTFLCQSRFVAIVPRISASTEAANQTLEGLSNGKGMNGKGMKAATELVHEVAGAT